jgi:hypothetical protein
MAVPTIRIARNDGSSTIVTPNFEPMNTNAAANGANAPNRAVATETLPATITLGQANNSAAVVAGLSPSDAKLTLPGERPLPQQE